MNYEPTMFIFFFKYQQINVWPFNTWISNNNTLNEARITSGTRHQLTQQYRLLLQRISMPLV